MTTYEEVFPIEEDSIKYDRNLRKNRDTYDSQKLIRDILATPMEDGPMYGTSDMVSFRKLSGMNVDIQTRIIMRMALQATSGDVKSAEFLFKYGGLEPPKEQTISIQTPTFIEDMFDGQIEDAEVRTIEGPESETEDVPDESDSELDVPVLLEPPDTV